MVPPLEMNVEKVMLVELEARIYQYRSDLQLAAELGKTLLNRNKELEVALRHQNNVVEEQAQEIEYLRKQTAALREVNETRLRIYEQLEVSIQDLELNNHRLKTQTGSDKKHISSLETQVEKLEAKCEELASRLAEKEKTRGDKDYDRANNSEDKALREEVTDLRNRNAKLTSKLSELQSDIDTITQENHRLEEQFVVMQHKQEELIVLEQVRQGEVCRRCLQNIEEFSLAGDDDDQISVIDSIINDNDHLKEKLGDLTDMENPYRILVEKYEALLRVERNREGRMAQEKAEPKCMSLQEELEMAGQLSSFTREEEVESDGVDDHIQASLTETETSSGFSDETINKATQTEAHVPPGSFLCTITQGNECKFSIYDEANSIDSRFRRTPEYKRLFREIFDALKREAETKPEDENPPLLEDMTPVKETAPSVPPVTPAVEEVPPPAVAEPPQTQATRHGRRNKHKNSPRRRREGGQGGNWRPTSMPTWPPPPQASPTTASQEVAKLRQLEKSYAEVLRLGRQHVNRN